MHHHNADEYHFLRYDEMKMQLKCYSFMAQQLGFGCTEHKCASIKTQQIKGKEQASRATIYNAFQKISSDKHLRTFLSIKNYANRLEPSDWQSNWWDVNLTKKIKTITPHEILQNLEGKYFLSDKKAYLKDITSQRDDIFNVLMVIDATFSNLNKYFESLLLEFLEVTLRMFEHGIKRQMVRLDEDWPRQILILGSTSEIRYATFAFIIFAEKILNSKKIYIDDRYLAGNTKRYLEKSNLENLHKSFDSAKSSFYNKYVTQKEPQRRILY